MLWIKYIIKTNTKDSDMVCAVLSDYGVTDVQIENNVQLTDEEMNQMYADFVKELPEDDGTASVSFYLDEKGFIPEGIGTGDSPSAANSASGYEGVYVDIEEIKNGLNDAHEMFGIEPVYIEKEITYTEDWENKWKEAFKTFSVGDIIIKPSWEEPDDDLKGKKVLNIDPGMAFGTGTHETTKLCLLALQKYLKTEDRVLDLGCGSGILGIAALKSGASYVTAVDIDEQAVKVAEENFSINLEAEANDRKKAAYELMTGNILNDDKLRLCLSEKKYDIVLANILAEVIIPLTAQAADFIKPGGIFISSGIIDNKEEAVIEAIKKVPEFEILQVTSEGDWRCIAARRK